MNIRTLFNYVAKKECNVKVTGEIISVYDAKDDSFAFNTVEVFASFPFGHEESDNYYSYRLEEFLDMLESFSNSNLSCVYLLGYTQAVNGFLPQLVQYAEENGLEIAIAEKAIAIILAILESEDC